MSAAYQIRVYENQQLLHSFECEGVVELGRQAEGESGPFRQKRDAGRTRLVIAHLNEPSLSRKHVLIEPIAEERFRITNLSSTQPLYSLEGGEVKFQTGRELAAPVVLTLGKKTLRIQPSVSATEGLQALAEAVAPPLVRAGSGPWSGQHQRQRRAPAPTAPARPASSRRGPCARRRSNRLQRWRESAR